MTAQARVNRTLLALAGLVLLGGGLLVLAGGLDVYRHWHLAPPGGWPLTTPQDILLSAADRTRWTGHDWSWPVVIAALALITLLALWWLLSQLRRSGPRHVHVGGPSAQEGVELHGHALSDAIGAEATLLPGVEQARTRMAGRPTRARTHITLTLTPDGAPEPVLRALSDGPLEHACRSTGWTRLPAQARLRVARHRPHRVT